MLIAVACGAILCGTLLLLPARGVIPVFAAQMMAAAGGLIAPVFQRSPVGELRIGFAFCRAPSAALSHSPKPAGGVVLVPRHPTGDSPLCRRTARVHARVPVTALAARRAGHGERAAYPKLRCWP
jgi:hypothetical protein